LLDPADSASIGTIPRADVCNPNKGFTMNLLRIFSGTVPMILLLFCRTAHAQVSSGSDGSDGALDFGSLTNNNYASTNVVVDMHDHPNGIYQYTYINIPGNVSVTFIPNANNTPVTWLVQSNVVINGTVDVSGQNASSYYGGPPGIGQGGRGGPGGYQGGNGGVTGSGGQGPGAGLADGCGEPAAFGTYSTYWNGSQYVSNTNGGSIYGNSYLIPLIGGSGGGGSTNTVANCGGGGGGGGGGAILMVSSQTIQLSGSINANGGGGTIVPCGYGGNSTGGAGSGGGVRLVATQIAGNGSISTAGVGGSCDYNAGNGRVRFDTFQNAFGGGIGGAFTQGSQFIIFPTSGQGAQLTVTSVGGVPVSASPTGVLSTPDAVLSAQQNNPIPVVVSCANLPLNTQITVTVKPANGAAVSATGNNNTGTMASSTATISIVIPRGGGLVYATAASSN
jgi:hypothetical protein